MNAQLHENMRQAANQLACFVENASISGAVNVNYQRALRHWVAEVNSSERALQADEEETERELQARQDAGLQAP